MVTTEWIVASPRIPPAKRLLLRGFRIEAKARAGQQQGFTMMETLVALVLFTVVLLGTLGGAATVAWINAQGGKTSRAMLLAQERMEQLKAGGYAALASGSNTVGGFSRSWTVATGPQANTRRVDVTVTWTVPRSGSITLTMVMSQ
ncbi:MAG: prepilin-type N-terminal cleavage/methylation domain-containing protein [Nitrospinae bacterium]|nr:prepilin-type N-terminal cleavage/methylation domain-containing protein [Nitrospinota bacterium]